MKPALFSLSLFAAFMAAFVVSSAHGSSDVELADGNALLRLCEAAVNAHPSRSDFADGMFLMGYVRGVADGQPRSAQFNIPPGVTTEQSIRIIKKWLEDHPKMLDRPPHFLILLALKDAYPATTP